MWERAKVRISTEPFGSTVRPRNSKARRVLRSSPTLHPWYLLWLLPFAAAALSPGWLVLCLTVVLAYTGSGSDVPWAVRCLEYGIPLAVAVVHRFRRRDV